MRMIKLHNPMDKDITDYPIDEAVIGEDGNLIKLEAGGHKVTGQTLTWTIKSGETLDFPFYVADILMDRYEQKDPNAKNRGLEKVEGVVGVDENKEVTEEAAKPKDGGIKCKECGKELKNMRGLGLHIAMAHPDKIK